MNQRYLLIPATIAFACALHATGTQAQTAPTQTQPGAGAARSVDGAEGQASRLTRAEKSFLDDAAHNGHAEVKSSQLALQKAQNPKVRSFAQQMVDDHTKANQELAALASGKNARVPDGPSLMQEGKLKLLGTADGADFDKRYMETMGLQAHRDTIELFEKGARDARDPEVKAFAQKTLPKLKQHLEMAQQLAQEVGVSADKAAASGK
ncbi:DUF4142 domain-containing protein [Paracidovorax citrulli]|uniref:DUF4142 domain-containing protein n=2 Tax=Paracidovorax citrulli TaxID=80869 RepID=A1TT21_PARC0|nr:DUF4142 domain-containing protein [Paracidovorax citrulli]ABM34109.1 conserved hypothetical protein [Paracidovorax citrulli AAC00-1]ATG93621.1 DUF4142 domain-containing protein [Paracidovorax citrulli]PVY63547.1 putative membrane protein [Paracidovorax citrulli]QCX09543.1 hypothetical protein APS58_0600 [Paracidovorax citrulli]REG67487.1 putative membrane protein [Paracidovorax citrulli]